jgi:hypothetical protein
VVATPIKGPNADLLTGLLNTKQPASTTGAEETNTSSVLATQTQKQKEALLQTLIQATSVLNQAASTAGGIGGAGACIPSDGLSLRKMVEDPSSCTVITLKPGVIYNVALPGKPDDVTVSSRYVWMYTHTHTNT